MILLVGLGNPGKEYKDTRHNVGFEVADRLSDSWKLSKKFEAEVSELNIEGEKVILAKPQAYMNLSGKVVLALSNFYKIPPENVWVVSDDVDLKLGEVRVRKSGSSGGHKGIQSIIDSLGTSDFPRFRIGIKTERFTDVPTEKYVLEKFSKEELPTIKGSIEKTASAIKKALREGIEHLSI